MYNALRRWCAKAMKGEAEIGVGRYCQEVAGNCCSKCAMGLFLQGIA